MTSVFLSGAIEGCDDLGRTWRQDATGVLLSQGYRVLDPSVCQGVFHDHNELVDRNVFLQRQADVLLVEYTIPNRAYVGTDYELAMAKEWKQPTVVFAHSDNAKRMYLKFLSSYLTSTLDDALRYLMTVYPSLTQTKTGEAVSNV